MALDYSNWWQYMSPRQTGAYEVKTGQTTWAAPVTVNNVYREPQGGNDEWAMEFGLENRQTQRFDFWTSQLGAVRPKLNDRWTDVDGAVWLVRDVRKLDYDANGVQRFKCLMVGKV